MQHSDGVSSEEKLVEVKQGNRVRIREALLPRSTRYFYQLQDSWRIKYNQFAQHPALYMVLYSPFQETIQRTSSGIRRAETHMKPAIVYNRFKNGDSKNS